VVLALAGLVLASAAGLVGLDFFRFAHSPMAPNHASSITLEIQPGTPVAAVARRLAQDGLIDRPLYFRLLARVTGAARRIKAGEYVVDPDTTPYHLLRKFVAGDVKTYSITIVEGWTFAEMMKAIRSNDVIRHTLRGKSSAQIMAALGHPDQKAEGRFFPDTYQFTRGTPDTEILQRAYKRMHEVLMQAWSKRDDDLPFDSPYDALILASIIERETAVPSERARIAGVFVERLERGMRLQTDPTVIYGLGDQYHGDLRLEDLRKDTPYNTYTRKGLPPTPIALPSQASIHAAVHPERRGELYFVATGNGHHVFSKTLKQHNKAVIKYQLGGDASRLRK